MLDQGFNMDATAIGKDHTVLHLKYALVNKAFAHQFGQGDVFEKSKAVGCKRVELTDGFDEMYYWNLYP